MSKDFSPDELTTGATPPKELALASFLESLRLCRVESALARHLHYERGVLQVFEDLYDLRAYGRIFVLAAGKAAQTMAGAFAAMLGTGVPLAGIVCSPQPPASPLPNFRYYQGGHPEPNEDSLRAAAAALHALGTLGEQDLAVFLISGGASAMLELPCDERLSLEELRQTHRALVLCGAPINEINILRKHLSAVKGGRLAAAAYPARQLSLFVSDVPQDSLASLASGPTLPDPSTLGDCQRILQERALATLLPEGVTQLFAQCLLDETPKSDEHCFVPARWSTLLSNEDLCLSAARELKRRGLVAEIDCRCDDWEFGRAAEYLLQRLRKLRRSSGAPCAIVSGGELSVRVPAGGGVGGRNQHFALACARQIAGEAITVLSAGSDGIDGNSVAAGAIADGSTLQRAAALGLDTETFLRRFDAYPLFHSLGDIILTGPTGNNLRDLRLLIAQ
jgi:hydroxypyruvate reductase